MQPKGRFLHVYFSDDACLGIRQPDGSVSVFNLDIGKCDRSHHKPIFDELVNLAGSNTQVRDDLQVLIDQLKQPFTVRSRGEKKKGMQAKVSLVHEDGDCILLSGSTITTAINNIASVSIAYSVVTTPDDHGWYHPGSITQAAYNAGYLMTVDVCKQPEDIQFLKHSPAYDTTGKLRALLNWGVCQRASWHTAGDFIGRKHITIRDRAIAHQKGLLHGMFPRVSFPMLDSMKEDVSSANEALYTRNLEITRANLVYKTDTSELGETVQFTDQAAFKRYRLDPYELTNLTILRPRFGYYTSCHASLQVYMRDYGVFDPPTGFKDGHTYVLPNKAGRM
jgi:hypothetical protein